MLREAFSGGPAYLTWNGLTIQLHEDWDAKVETKTVERKTNLQGTVGRGLDYIIVKITGKPIATNVNLASLFTKLHPHLASARGTLIFPATDLPAVIQGKDGRSITFGAAMITQEPNVNFAPNVDLFENFELTCLLETDGDSATIADFVVEASSAYTEPTLDQLSIISERYALAWGETSPFDDIETDEKGIVLETNLSLKDCMTQRDGLLNYRIEDKTASVKFTPVNLAGADFVDLIAMIGRGKMTGNFGQELTVLPVSGDGPSLTVPLAVPVDPVVRFGQESRVGEVTMNCERKFSTTLLEPYTLAVESSE